MRLTPLQVALLLTLLLRRAEKNRARVSRITIKKLAKRTCLRIVFLQQLTKELEDLGVLLIELENGGFGIMLAKSLEGAKAITRRRIREDLRAIQRDQLTYADIYNELFPDLEDEDEDEDE